MFKPITNFLATITLVFGVTGCTNTPTITEADIPLVHSSLTYSLINTTALTNNAPKANRLFNASDLTPITFEGVRYRVEERYISATGNKCMRFVSSDNENVSGSNAMREKLTSCERDGIWVVIKPLVAMNDMEGV